MKKIKNGFTLVELIIVITILAILSSIAFVSFNGYVLKSRDTVRISNLKQSDSSLRIFFTQNGTLPMPDSFVKVMDGSDLLMYEGFFGKNNSMVLKIDEIIDPITKDYFDYSVSFDKKKFSIMTKLEANNLSYISKTYADNSIFTSSAGDDVGIILTSSGKNLNTISQTTFDLSNYSSDIIVVKNSNNSYGNKDVYLDNIYNKSCKTLRQSGYITSGVYKLYGSGGLYNAYCDMTTHGGGWTLVFSQNYLGEFFDGTNQITDFEGSKNCEGYNENCVNYSYTNVKITDGIILDGGHKNIYGDITDSKTLFTGVDDVKGKTIYYLFNNTGSTLNSGVKNYWGVTGIKILQDFENTISAGYTHNNYPGLGNLLRDYYHLVYHYKRLALNDNQGTLLSGGYMNGLISGEWSNGCKWPTKPCFPEHWYSNYRMWIR